MTKRVIVIGSGFSGLTAATLLAQQGHSVTVLEKNEQAGGRARVWKEAGFTFDMGPSWYWMPEVFEQYYNSFGYTTSDFYKLERLDPSYRIYHAEGRHMDVPAGTEALYDLFESKEPGSSVKLKQFLGQAQQKYEVAMSDYVGKLSDSVSEFLDLQLLLKSFRLKLFRSLRSEVRAAFKHPELHSLLEFPVLFLGASPSDIPSLYSMMNYADLVLGTWYPQGGMNRIVQAMLKIAAEQHVDIQLNTEVSGMEVLEGKAARVHTNKGDFECDLLIAGSDYRHTEQELLPETYRRYNEKYWDKRNMSPSSLLFFLGVNKKIPGLLHHNLFFDTDFESHSDAIYKSPRWPEQPLFYVCAPSVTDNSVAPEGCENLFVLVPLAPGLYDSEEERESCYTRIMERLETRTGIAVRQHVLVKRSYAMNDFTSDYHAFKGNAYGLANTLRQTAFLKPKMKSKIRNMLYTGQLTVPGPGVPPAIISGQIAAKEAARMVHEGLV